MSIHIPDGLAKLFHGLTGMAWPEADEDKLRLAGDDYLLVAKDMPQLEDYIRDLTAYCQGQVSGRTGDGFADMAATLISIGGGSALAEAAEQAKQLGKVAHDTANQVEYTKWMIIGQLVQLAAEIAWAIAAAPFTGGASLGEAVAAKLVTQAVLRKILAWLIDRILMHTFVSIAGGVVMDTIIQLIQIEKGHKSEWDTKSLLQAVEFGALNGLIGGPLSLIGAGLTKLFRNVIAKGLGKEAGRVLGGDLAKVSNGLAKDSLGTVLSKDGLKAIENDATKALGKDIGKAAENSLANEAGHSAAGAAARDAAKGAENSLANEAAHSAAGAAARDGEKWLAKESAEAFGNDLAQTIGRYSHDIANAFKGGLRELPAQAVARFEKDVAQVFEKHFGAVLGKEEAAALGKDFAKAMAANGGRGAAEHEALRDAMRAALKPGGLSSEGVDQLVEHLPGLLDKVGGDTKLFKVGMALGGYLGGGVQNGLTEGFYNLTFGPDHEFSVSWESFVSGMAMGFVGHMGHLAVHPLVERYKVWVSEKLADPNDTGPETQYLPWNHPLTILSAVANLTGRPTPFPVPRPKPMPVKVEHSGESAHTDVPKADARGGSEGAKAGSTSTVGGSRSSSSSEQVPTAPVPDSVKVQGGGEHQQPSESEAGGQQGAVKTSSEGGTSPSGPVSAPEAPVQVATSEGGPEEVVPPVQVATSGSVAPEAPRPVAPEAPRNVDVPVLPVAEAAPDAASPHDASVAGRHLPDGSGWLLHDTGADAPPVPADLRSVLDRSREDGTRYPVLVHVGENGRPTLHGEEVPPERMADILRRREADGEWEPGAQTVEFLGYGDRRSVDPQYVQRVVDELGRSPRFADVQARTGGNGADAIVRTAESAERARTFDEGSADRRTFGDRLRTSSDGTTGPSAEHSPLSDLTKLHELTAAERVDALRDLPNERRRELARDAAVIESLKKLGGTREFAESAAHLMVDSSPRIGGSGPAHRETVEQVARMLRNRHVAVKLLEAGHRVSTASDGRPTTTREVAHAVLDVLSARDRAIVREAHRAGLKGDGVGEPTRNDASRGEHEYFARVTDAYLGTDGGPDRVRRNEPPELSALLKRLYGKDPAHPNDGNGPHLAPSSPSGQGGQPNQVAAPGQGGGPTTFVAPRLTSGVSDLFGGLGMDDRPGNRVFDGATKNVGAMPKLSEADYLAFLKPDEPDALPPLRPLGFVVSAMTSYKSAGEIKTVIERIMEGSKGMDGRVAFVIGLNAPKGEEAALAAAAREARGIAETMGVPVAVVTSTFSWLKVKGEEVFPYGEMRNELLDSAPTHQLIKAMMDGGLHPYLAVQDYDMGSRKVPSGQHVFNFVEDTLHRPQPHPDHSRTGTGEQADHRLDVEDDALDPSRPLAFVGGYRMPTEEADLDRLVADVQARFTKKGKQLPAKWLDAEGRAEILEQVRLAVEADMLERDWQASYAPLLPYAPEPNLMVDGPAVLLADGRGTPALKWGPGRAEFEELGRGLNRINAWELDRYYRNELEGKPETVDVPRSTRPTKTPTFLDQGRDEIIERVRADASNNRLPNRGEAFRTDFRGGATVTDLSRLVADHLEKVAAYTGRGAGPKMALGQSHVGLATPSARLNSKDFRLGDGDPNSSARSARHTIGLGPYREDYGKNLADRFQNEDRLNRSHREPAGGRNATVPVDPADYKTPEAWQKEMVKTPAGRDWLLAGQPGPDGSATPRHLIPTDGQGRPEFGPGGLTKNVLSHSTSAPLDPEGPFAGIKAGIQDEHKLPTAQALALSTAAIRLGRRLADLRFNPERTYTAPRAEDAVGPWRMPTEPALREYGGLYRTFGRIRAENRPGGAAGQPTGAPGELRTAIEEVRKEVFDWMLKPANLERVTTYAREKGVNLDDLFLAIEHGEDRTGPTGDVLPKILASIRKAKLDFGTGEPVPPFKGNPKKVIRVDGPGDGDTTMDIDPVMDTGTAMDIDSAMDIDHPAPEGTPEPGPAVPGGASRPVRSVHELELLAPEARRELARDAEYVKSLRESLEPEDFADAAARLIVDVDPRTHQPVAARHAAYEQVVRMLRDPKVAERLLTQEVRVVVVPRDVPITEVAGLEHLNDLPEVDGRPWRTVRGVQSGKIVVVTEENLLGARTTLGRASSHPEGYSTTTHELAHAIHKFGLTGDEHALVREAYRGKRQADGLTDLFGEEPVAAWPDGGRRNAADELVGNYSSADEYEYFAQLSNAYLGTNHGNDPGTRLPRNNGADWVRRNDPELLPLLERLYGPDPQAGHPAPANPVSRTRAEEELYGGFREFMRTATGEPHPEPEGPSHPVSEADLIELALNPVAATPAHGAHGALLSPEGEDPKPVVMTDEQLVRPLVNEILPSPHPGMTFAVGHLRLEGEDKAGNPYVWTSERTNNGARQFPGINDRDRLDELKKLSRPEDDNAIKQGKGYQSAEKWRAEKVATVLREAAAQHKAASTGLTEAVAGYKSAFAALDTWVTKPTEREAAEAHLAAVAKKIEEAVALAATARERTTEDEGDRSRGPREFWNKIALADTLHAEAAELHRQVVDIQKTVKDAKTGNEPVARMAELRTEAEDLHKRAFEKLKEYAQAEGDVAAELRKPAADHSFGYQRKDAEVSLLNAAYRQLESWGFKEKNQVSGTFTVFSTKGTCESCKDVVRDLNQAYPGIRVVAAYPKDDGKLPPSRELTFGGAKINVAIPYGYEHVDGTFDVTVADVRGRKQRHQIAYKTVAPVARPSDAATAAGAGTQKPEAGAGAPESSSQPVKPQAKGAWGRPAPQSFGQREHAGPDAEHPVADHSGSPDAPFWPAGEAPDPATADALAHFPHDPAVRLVALHTKDAQLPLSPRQLADRLIEWHRSGGWDGRTTLRFVACDLASQGGHTQVAEVLAHLAEHGLAPEIHAATGPVWFVPDHGNPDGPGHLLVAAEVGIDAHGRPVVVPGGHWVGHRLGEDGVVVRTELPSGDLPPGYHAAEHTAGQGEHHLRPMEDTARFGYHERPEGDDSGSSASGHTPPTEVGNLVPVAGDGLCLLRAVAASDPRGVQRLLTDSGVTSLADHEGLLDIVIRYLDRQTADSLPHDVVRIVRGDDHAYRGLTPHEYVELVNAVHNWRTHWATSSGDMFAPLAAHALGVRLRIVHTQDGASIEFGDPAARQVTVFYTPGPGHYDASDLLHRPEAPERAQALATQIETTGDTISRVIIRGRPDGPYSDTMGDHSTAFAVQVSAVTRHLEGRTFDHAMAGLRTLTDEVHKLPGAAMIDGLPTDHRWRIAEAERELVELEYLLRLATGSEFRTSLLQQYASAFLHYRELIPLSTINVAAVSRATAGKGKAEAAPNRLLNAFEDGGDRIRQTDLQDAILGLFDPRAAARVVAELDPDTLARLAPGMPSSATREQRMAALVEQHLRSVDLAFPRAFDAAWGHDGDRMERAAVQLKMRLRPEVRQVVDDYLRNSKLDVQAKLNELERAQQDAVLLPKRQKEKAEVAIGALRREGTALEELTRKFEEMQLDLSNDPAATGNPTAPSHDGDRPSGRNAQYAAGTGLPEEETGPQARLATQAVIGPDGRVERLLFAGRSPSPFSGTMGAHTTAWVVHQDVIRRAVTGEAIPQAMRNLVLVAQHTVHQQAARRGVIGIEPYHQERLDAARSEVDDLVRDVGNGRAGTSPQALQRFVNSLLTYTNYLPGATIETANTNGRAEATHRAFLRGHPAGAGASAAQLAHAVVGLFDVHDVQEDAALVLAEHHRELIEWAYPGVLAAAGLGSARALLNAARRAERARERRT
ncbi:hypothetical protein AB0C76_03245 [Kitasatospora sp. NPDC048722]|uniref:WXG100-like domain-containing protein n=1 Tax=Kitasatospora sp. NPDC048722 TaxID=3155639 RepID=UPI0033EBF215